MLNLKDKNLKNRRVLLRVEFNVPIERGEVLDDFRIKKTLPTIEYLIKQGAKVILISHIDRPELDGSGRVLPEDFKRCTQKPLANYLTKILGRKVHFIADCFSQTAESFSQTMQAGGVALLENVRFYLGEKKNEDSFARALARLGDFYVNDAFGAAHRSHASIVGIPKHLPSCPGLLMQKEIEVLSRVMNNPEKPLAIIIGGVKIGTKVKVINNFMDKADDIMLGGALANTVLAAKGIAVGSSVIDRGTVEEVNNLDLTDSSLHLPVDAVVSEDSSGSYQNRVAPIGKTKNKEMIFDIGPDTCDLFRGIIDNAKTVIWNGPMGMVEVEEFKRGSRCVAEAIAYNGYSVVGGGSTVTLLEEIGELEKIQHASTGGGAMLNFLAGEDLPGIEALH